MQATPRRPDLGAVRDVDVIEAVGLEAMGLLSWMTAQASPTADLPGGWALVRSVREMTSALRIGNDKLGKLLTALKAAGLIYVEEGKRYGRGGGSGKHRYWLTFDPAIPSPRGPREAFPFQEQATLSTPDVGGFQDRNVQPGNRHLTSVREDIPVLAAPSSGTSTTPVHPVDDGSSNTSAVRTDAPKMPAFLVEALREVGWQGAPPSGDPLLISVVARHLARSGTWKSPGGQLNKLIRQNELQAYALFHHLVTSDPTGALGEYQATAPAPTLMPYEQLCDLQDAEPGWYAVVVTEARRQAEMSGERVSMALIRQVAASVPLPEGQARTS